MIPNGSLKLSYKSYLAAIINPTDILRDSKKQNVNRLKWSHCIKWSEVQIDRMPQFLENSGLTKRLLLCKEHLPNKFQLMLVWATFLGQQTRSQHDSQKMNQKIDKPKMGIVWVIIDSDVSF